MMEALWSTVWAALEISFAALFFGAFLDGQRRPNGSGWLLLGLWLLSSLYGLFRLEGLYGYLVYLLSAVLILLCLYGEYGPRGLCLLVFAFGIPVALDGLSVRLAAEAGPLWEAPAVTAGKALALLLALAVKRMRSHAGEKSLTRQEQDHLLLRQHMQMQRESIHTLEQNYRIQRKSAHEFEHHLQVLRDLLDRDQVEAARAYLDRLKKNRSIHVMSVSSRHPVVDVILNQKYQTALENEITMQIRVGDLSEVTIPADSLAVVLTNLLDNAIEACRRVSGYREIFCSILYEGALYISIRNTSGPVELRDGKLPTTKEDPLRHGFGLMSVSHILDGLGAEYTFGYEEGWFHFAAEIEP